MIKPLENFVLIERIQSPNVTNGGIQLPEITKKTLNKGKVLDFGPGIYTQNGNLIPIEGLTVGNIVYFPAYSGNEIEEDGKTLLFLRANELLGVK